MRIFLLTKLIQHKDPFLCVLSVKCKSCTRATEGPYGQTRVLWHKATESIDSCLGWDASPSQDGLADTNLYWMERENVKKSFLYGEIKKG